MKITDIPLYDRVYYVNLPELMKNPGQWYESEELPICKIENTQEITRKETTTNEQLPTKTIATIHCPKMHIKDITTYHAQFNENHPCTVLEYQRPVVKGSQTKKWAFRVFQNGGIDTDGPDITMKQIQDIAHQITMRRSTFYQKNTKRK